MKNAFRQIVAALSLWLILCGSNIGFAQTAKRIQFAKGGNTATVKGTGSQSYVLRVGAEQTVKLRLVSKDSRATFDLLDADGSDLSEGTDGLSLEMGTAVAGDYRLNITAPKGTAFTLTITIK